MWASLCKRYERFDIHPILAEWPTASLVWRKMFMSALEKMAKVELCTVHFHIRETGMMNRPSSNERLNRVQFVFEALTSSISVVKYELGDY